MGGLGCSLFLREIPQKIIDQRVKNGGDLNGIPSEKIEKIPQKFINQCAAKGGNLFGAREKQIANIPQGVINQCAENGGDLHCFSYQQIENIPQISINLGVSLGKTDINDGLFTILDAQKKAIPEAILEIDENAKNALILYGAGKIGKEDLPTEVYANPGLRHVLLHIIKTRTMKRFNEGCIEYGYLDNVPAEIVEEFDKRLEAMGKEVEELRVQSVIKLTEKQSSSVSALKEEISGLEW